MVCSFAKLSATTALAMVLSMGTAANALAGGGDFVGGMIVGGVLGTILGAGVHHSSPPRRVYRARPAYDQATVKYWRDVQQALNEVGIYVGRPDGVPGARTRSGVKTFQNSLNTEPTGQLTQVEYQELMRQAGAAVAMGGGPVDAPTLASNAWQPAAPPLAPAAIMPANQSQPVAANAFAPPSAAETAPAPVAPTQQVAAATPAAPANTAVIDALLTPTKALDDKDIDALEDASTVLGVYIGDTQTAAADAFTKGIGNCATAGTLTECVSKTDAYADKAAFATTKGDNGETVYYLSRSIEFKTPVPKAAIVAKLSETIKDIAADADMTLSTAAVCDRSLASGLADRQNTIGTYARDAATGAAGMAALIKDCQAFFTASIPLKDGQATGLDVTLFDGRALPDLAAPSAAAPQIPAGIKF